MRSADLPLPSRAELRACGLAALGEAGIVYLPVHLVLSEAGALASDLWALALPFVAVYVAGAMLACRFRSSRNLATAAAVLATLAGVSLGRGGLDRVAFAIVASLLVALRILTLGLRDWRTPVHAALGWGAAALGAEAFAAAGPMPEWRPLLLVIVPLFFAAGLASRATTVWAGAEERRYPDTAPWAKRTLLAIGGLAVAMAVAVSLAVRGGLFEVVGRWLRPVMLVVEAAFFFLVIQAARPFFWLAEQLNIDPQGFREALARLRRSVGQARERVGAHPLPPSFGQRIVGLLVFAAIGYAVYRLLRYARPGEEFDQRSLEPRAAADVERPAERIEPAPRWRFRPELPAEAVRRLYAEVLLDLRDHDLRKDPSLTPGEFVPQVAASFPAGAEDFGALTRAYEDVRYGGRRLGREDVRGLEHRQRHLLTVLRRGGGRPVVEGG
jgi:hypothetical protein